MIHDVHDHYRVLGVTTCATEDELRAAHKALIRVWHPDVNPAPNAPEMMALINRARDVLCDAKTRGDYDMLEPPPPVVILSSYSVDLSDRARSVKVTVTSSREIGVFSPTRLSGPGWEVEIVPTEPSVATLVFHRSGKVQTASGPVTDTFVGDIDGTSFRLDIRPKSDTVRSPTTTRKSAGRSPAASRVVVFARGWSDQLTAHLAPHVSVVLVALIANAKHASVLQKIEISSPKSDPMVVMSGMLRANAGLVAACLLGLLLLRSMNSRVWVTPRLAAACCMVYWAMGMHFVLGCVASAAALVFVHRGGRWQGLPLTPGIRQV